MYSVIPGRIEKVEKVNIFQTSKYLPSKGIKLIYHHPVIIAIVPAARKKSSGKVQGERAPIMKINHALQVPQGN